MEERIAEPPAPYWDEYTNLQHVKHDLIRHYLGGWFPKLIQGGARKVVYLDTHAGRGRHRHGQPGSPLVALETLLNHAVRKRLLDQSEVTFVFIEKDEANLEVLKAELVPYEPLPAGIKVVPACGDCFQILENMLCQVGQTRRLAPSFIFCDPFGFKIHGSVLKRLMKHQQVELFVNIMWRELDMGRPHVRAGKRGWEARLDTVFGGRGWRSTINSPDAEERAEQCAQLLRKTTEARWATYIRMLGRDERTRYFLLHLTNHDAGRDLMKDCMWKACPDGGYYARKTDDPRQQFLITPQPDLTPLREWVMAELARHPQHWKRLENELRETIWRSPHLTKVLRNLRESGDIVVEGKFTKASNPLLSAREQGGRRS